MKFFEDFSPDSQWEFGKWSVTPEEAKAFAQEYDPQPIHVDEVLAGKTQFGGTIVSGWLTTLKCVRHFVDGVMKETAGLASPGVEEIRWLKPLKPNQTVTACARVMEIREAASKPDRGIVRFEIFGRDETGETIMTTNGIFFIAKRPQSE